MRTTPDNITTLKINEVFVFGSNEAGIHGAGAARLAFEEFGATWGQGFGLSGRTFALPTKDKRLETLPLDKIETYVKDFLKWASSTPDTIYLLTPIGCGLAGYRPINIAPMFKGVPDNVILPQSFHDILNN